MPFEPELHSRMFVGTIIDYNQMKIQSEGGFSTYLLEETNKLLVSMTRYAVADNFAVQHTECRKQGGRAVALVIVSHRSAHTAFFSSRPG